MVNEDCKLKLEKRGDRTAATSAGAPYRLSAPARHAGSLAHQSKLSD